jgi:hypothetical protein
MDNEENTEARTPTIREELEGFVRSLFATTTENSAPKIENGAPRMISPPSPPPPPPMRDVEQELPKTDGKRDVAEQVAVMLRDLFESQDTFVISNAGVQAIIDGLLKRYRERESPVLREKLLVHWRQDVPRLRAALTEAAKDDPLVLDTGQEVSLVTTQKAQALLDRFCPQTVYLPETQATRNVR